MRLAYADPPYPGRAHLYEGHPDYAGEVDHEALIEHLNGWKRYDGWALSTSAAALRELLPLCPPDVRVLAGADQSDTLDDLFPGSGAVGEAWDRWCTQPPLASFPSERRARRDRARMLAEHPTLTGDAA